MNIKILTADDWRALRKVRLQALADSPDAYLSSHDVVRRWTETQWRHTFTDSLWVLTGAGRQTVGLARSVQVRGRPAYERHIESVWVDPGHRGTGVFRAILAFLTEQEPTVRDWLVWVLDGNAGARAVYERLGFEPTGEGQPLPDNSGRWEERLRLRLRPASSH